MKKLITILSVAIFLLSSCATVAQPVMTLNNTYGMEFKRIAADTADYPPFLQSLLYHQSSFPNRPSIAVWQNDTTLWISPKSGRPYSIRILDRRDTTLIANMLANSGLGHNISNSNLTANGTYSLVGDGYDLRIDDYDDIFFRVNDVYIQDSTTGNYIARFGQGQVQLGDVAGAVNGTKLAVSDGANLIAAYGQQFFTSAILFGAPNIPDYSSGGYYPLVWNQGTQTFQYCSSCTFGGGGSNLATADQTATGDRFHDWDGFDLTISDIDQLQFISSQAKFQGNFTAGDPAGVGVGTKIDVKPGTDQILLDGETKIETSASFIVRNNTGDEFLDFNMAGKTYNIGDLDATNNATSIVIDDNNSAVTVTSNEGFGSQDASGYLGMFLDYNSRQFTLGDASVSGNNTAIVIDDAANTIQLKSNGISSNPENDSTLAVESGTGIVKHYYQPYIYKKITGSTNGSTVTSTILTTSNRTSYRIQVDYVGKNGSLKAISGTKQAVYYGSASVLTVCAPSDIQPEGVLNMSALGYCNIVTSGGDIQVEFHTDAADGAIDWDIIVRIKIY